MNTSVPVTAAGVAVVSMARVVMVLLLLGLGFRVAGAPRFTLDRARGQRPQATARRKRQPDIKAILGNLLCLPIRSRRCGRSTVTGLHASVIDGTFAPMGLCENRQLMG
ncbi:hypothetical protein [Gluconobacter japonicus]|uniref:Uncharacterized protein n=1 Tax=Gluconobacter japonicus TaxID=376620 RepID=A0A9Q2FSN3_GLUJA|nr:hypothetical protein [Gluconobacter japonicus]MBF0871783.1 hypothetical protein [Gluconobacter japonicus]